MTIRRTEYYGCFDLTPKPYDGPDWEEINSASHGNAVRMLSKKDFEYLYRRVTPLPPEAFRSATAEPWYGSFDGLPSRYALGEAWVFRGGKVNRAANRRIEIAAKARDAKMAAAAAVVEAGMKEAHAVLVALPNQ